MTKRKFHRTVIEVEVLSEQPFEWNDLGDVAYAINQGDCSGKVTQTHREIVDGKAMARMLKAQASDPDFFNLTDGGEEKE